MRLLVCGGRTYNDMEAAFSVMDRLHRTSPITLVIQGGAKGADEIAKCWAVLAKVECKEVKADWKTFGKSAGPIRNKQMLEMNPDRVLALPGGRGTANMVSQARAAGVLITEIL
jgi:hypothetical protein